MRPGRSSPAGPISPSCARPPGGPQATAGSLASVQAALGEVIHAIGGDRPGEESWHLRQGARSAAVSVRGAVQVGAHGEGQGERGQQRLGRQLQLLQLGLLQPLGLGPAVLKPDLDLRLSEAQAAGELGALGDGQVLLLAELALQGQQLRGREGRPRLAVGLVLAQGAGRGAQPPWGRGRAREKEAGS